jgi:eukaryotic-like serine/threonine-protein kinase
MNQSDKTPPNSLSTRTWFETLLGMEANERQRQLNELPSELAQKLRALLQGDAEQLPLLKIAPAVVAAQWQNSVQQMEAMVGRNLGAFRITGLLGAGGSATVFRAERSIGDALQVVALKVLRGGLLSPDAERRFAREKAILAQLSHPNIARLIEAGVDQFGTPFIAMELVQGQTLTLHADHSALDLRARIGLMITLCRAVDAAHASLVVHRDLKPSNVMVDQHGVIKILDFGIAKLLDDDDLRTQTQLIMLTPEYAAPEQFKPGPSTVAVDIYALGVILGEMLTGHLLGCPHTQCASIAVKSRPSNSLPAGLATRGILARQLRGDLDAIIASAIAEEPVLRYRSAAALADDLQRYLAGHPVQAHPPSRWYRARKFMQRHRGGVVLTTLLVLGMLCSLIFALWQARAAHQQAYRADLIRDFVLNVFESARVSLPEDQKPSPKTFADQARRQLLERTNLDLATQVDLHRTLAEIWLSMSEFEDASESLNKALDAAEAMRDEVAQLELRVIQLEIAQRRGRGADVLHDTPALIAKLAPGNYPYQIRARRLYASALLATKSTDAALHEQTALVEMLTRQSGKLDTDTLAAGFDLGHLYGLAQRHAEAESTLLPLLSSWRAQHAVEDDRYVRALSSLASSQFSQGKLQDAEERFRELLEMKYRIYPAKHDSIAKSLRNLGVVLAQSSKHDEAKATLEQALSMQKQLLGDKHIEVAKSHDALGALMVSQQHLEAAAEQYVAALEVCTSGELRDELCTRARNNLGMVYYRQGRLAEAEREMGAALEQRRKLFGDAHPTVAYSLSTMANVADARHEHQRAQRLHEQALDLLGRLNLNATREAALARNSYANSLFLSGNLGAALEQIQQSILTFHQKSPEDFPRYVPMLILKAQILRALGKNTQLAGVLQELSKFPKDKFSLPDKFKDAWMELERDGESPPISEKSADAR